MSDNVNSPIFNHLIYDDLSYFIPSGMYARFNKKKSHMSGKTFYIVTSLNVDSLIGSKLPKIESTCLTTIIGLEIYLEQKQLQ